MAPEGRTKPMSARVPVELSAADIVQAMLDDGDFAREMWTEIADGLCLGLLLRKCIEQVEVGFGLDEKKAFMAALLLMADSIRTQIEQGGILN